MQAYLILANGRVFRGVSVGCPGTTIGEVVFATGMVGFEETLSLIHIYYESLGLDGMRAYAETLKLARATGLPVIADIKRGDIAKTAEMYAKAHFTGDFEADIITLAPYMGLDSISPYLPYLSLIHI